MLTSSACILNSLVFYSRNSGNTLYTYKASYLFKILLYPLAQYYSGPCSHDLAFLFSFYCPWYHVIVVFLRLNGILSIGQFYFWCELYWLTKCSFFKWVFTMVLSTSLVIHKWKWSFINFSLTNWRLGREDCMRINQKFKNPFI